jgi:hypothetical protein
MNVMGISKLAKVGVEGSNPFARSRIFDGKATVQRQAAARRLCCFPIPQTEYRRFLIADDEEPFA